MNIQLYKALWGMEGSCRDQLTRAAQAGYAGIEAPLPPRDLEREFKDLLAELQLYYIAQVVTSVPHQETFAEQVRRAADFDPKLIVSHSARDGMKIEDQLRFFEAALKIEQEVGFTIGHETHRSRAMFTPWTTRRLLEEFPELSITADFSHWCCVTESLLEDYAEDMEVAIRRTVHIHARVGYAQGPQVPHPGAPEYSRELAAFEAWWTRIVQYRSEQGFSYTSMTPEFGPAHSGYMHTLPFTGAPVTDLWDVNEWMAKRISERMTP
ncbi:TIM barrel protein [Paenibacillus lautus]|uniref:sugar phosphate isomerase/epimerase family protein n=1 Tax=Paenibacillus lautus TaxID=1401 RepID=UPI002DB9A6B1|nr:TIM barrel protein [Paenibacillus lautus]MEC0309114.1 TIM barrel protein [Paenibacillus lautus]